MMHGYNMVNMDQHIRVRKRVLKLLALPLIVEAIAFFIMTWITAFGHDTKAAPYQISLLYLMLSAVWLPAYCAGFLWYLIRSKNYPESLRRLYEFPPVVALLVFFPTVLMANDGLIELLKIYLFLFAITLIGCGILVGCIRMILRFSREI